MRVLFAWELGGNLGHLAQTREISKALSEKECEIFFALKNPLATKGFKDSFDYKVLQAPYKPPVHYYDEPLTYADDLMGCGYDDPEHLAILIRCWLNMFNLVKPDALITQSAPTALLAAKVYKSTQALKTFSFGSGYNVPPITNPMPPLRYWLNHPLGLLEEREEIILQNVNQALKILDVPPLNSFGEALKCDKEFLCTVPELDHYPSEFRKENQQDYYGVCFTADSGAAYQWKKAKDKRIFAYIPPTVPWFRECIEALRSLPSEYDIIVSAPNVESEFTDQVKKENLRISSEIIRLKDLLGTCDVAVTYASQGVSSAFALNGVPLVMIPGHVEQLMFAQKIVSLGLGVIAAEPYSARDITHKIHNTLSKSETGSAEQIFSNKPKDYNVEKQSQKIAEEIFALCS